MDPVIIEIIKSLYPAVLGVGTALLGMFGLSKKVKRLEEQNRQQQGNVDSMQTNMINHLAQLTRTQDELIQTRKELAELKDKILVFEVKSNEDEVIKQSLRGRVAELEETCERQEQEIVKLRAELAANSTRLTILEN